jgi:pimeloyl-ACP methyl ester carboxylesterase
VDQRIGYCTTEDGARIGYAVSGGGPVLVRAGNWYTHLQHDWDLSGWSAFLRALEKRFQLVRYDVRGTGLSDRFPAEISVATFVRDLEAVVDSLKLERFSLLGMSQGGAVGILYAIKHPERVSRLMLLNALARGAAFREGVGQGQEVVQAMRALIRRGWGSDDPSFRAIFTTQMMPTATQEQAEKWNELERLAVAPEVAERIFAAVHTEINILDRVAELRVPTLVMHVRDDRRVPFEEGRQLAAHTPGARFVPLPGVNHIVLPQDESLGIAVREICSFAGVAPASPVALGFQTLGNSLGGATKRFEASTYYKLLAILAAIASIVSLIWTIR